MFGSDFIVKKTSFKNNSYIVIKKIIALSYLQTFSLRCHLANLGMDKLQSFKLSIFKHDFVLEIWKVTNQTISNWSHCNEPISQWARNVVLTMRKVEIKCNVDQPIFNFESTLRFQSYSFIHTLFRLNRDWT